MPQRLPVPVLWIFQPQEPRIGRGFPGGSVVKNMTAKAGDMGLIPGLRKSPGEGSGNPLQYSCLENPMDGGTWHARDHGVTKGSDTTY